MKRFLALVLALAVMLTLSACGKDKIDDSSSELTGSSSEAVDSSVTGTSSEAATSTEGTSSTTSSKPTSTSSKVSSTSNPSSTPTSSVTSSTTTPSTPQENYIEPSDNVTFPAGAKAIFAGDSFCYGAYDSPVGYGWAGRMKDQYGLDSKNVGANGRTLATNTGRSTIAAEFNNVNLSDYDYIILHGGVNDIWMDHLNQADIPLGSITPVGTTSFNTDTVAGALEALFAKVKAEAPNAKVGFIITFNISSSIGNMAPFVSLAKEICNKWDVPYLDLYYHPTFSAELNANRRTYLNGGDPHPVKACYDSLVRYIAAWMGQL